jgi:hypothetical protein
MHLFICALLVTIGYFIIPGFKDDWSFLLAVLSFTFPLLWIYTCVEELFFQGTRKSTITEVLKNSTPAIILIAILGYFGPSVARFFFGV